LVLYNPVNYLPITVEYALNTVSRYVENIIFGPSEFKFNLYMTVHKHLMYGPNTKLKLVTSYGQFS